MNAYELFESMNGIDDALLEQSEEPGRGIGRFAKPAWIAACLALVLTVLCVQLNQHQPPVGMEATLPVETTEDLRQVVAEPYYNQGSIILDYRTHAALYHTMHDLTEEETAPLLPPKTAGWMSFTGRAMLLVDGMACQASFSTPSRIADAEILLVLGAYYEPYCDVYDKDAVAYLCGRTKYILGVAETLEANELTLFAEARVNGVDVYLEMCVPSAELERAKADFEEMLVCVDSYWDAMPDLSKVSPSQEAYAWYMPFDRETVKEDPYFSSFLPGKRFPECISMELTWNRAGDHDWIYIDCYRFGLFDWPQVSMSWNIWCWEDENFGSVIFELYDPIDAKDLTLEMVEQLIAESGQRGGRGTYHIRFGDHALISVSPHDVSARWLYEQLIAVRQRLEQAE